MYNILFCINLQDASKLSMCSVHSIIYKLYINCNYSNHNNITGQCLFGVFRPSSWVGEGAETKTRWILLKNMFLATLL